MSMRKTFKVILGLCFVAMSLAGMQAERNLLVKAQVGDWAQYLFNSQNETVPMLSVKDQQRWRVISVVEETGVRIDESFIMAGERSGPMGTIANFNRPTSSPLRRKIRLSTARPTPAQKSSARSHRQPTS
jgi:hypothetical protein